MAGAGGAARQQDQEEQEEKEHKEQEEKKEQKEEKEQEQKEQPSGSMELDQAKGLTHQQPLVLQTTRWVLAGWVTSPYTLLPIVPPHHTITTQYDHSMTASMSI